jgi:DNA-binding transcriptional MocR family regulator
MHLTMKLPNEISDTQIAERAAHQNLWIWPLSAAFFLAKRHSLASF